MARSRVGIWIIGARGAVATTAIIGWAALQRQLTGTAGLITTCPPWSKLDLVDWSDLVFGGHEIRDGTLAETFAVLQRQTHALDDRLLDSCRPELDEIDARIASGTLAQCGHTIEELAGADARSKTDTSPRATVRRLQADLRHFQQQTQAERVLVVNLASTEPPAAVSDLPVKWDELERLLDDRSGCPLPASSLYAIAALDLGMPYINFTPSLGAMPPPICQLAELRKTCHAGQDGKTGETLLKTVLAPMFAGRNLEVMSWVGHNIFGNLDSKVLDDPANKASKIRTKDRVLGQILGYDPQTLVSIEYIQSMGDWKTAWDHIHFRGFLETPMTMQFTWQGCDSILAAPLVLDLIRLVEFAARQRQTGVLTWLAAFFKSPLGTCEHNFFRQLAMLQDWAETNVR